MFHKRAMKNTIVLSVFLTLVFSTLVIAILAASATATTNNLELEIEGIKNWLGDKSVGTANYRLGTHKHNGFDSYSHTDSSIYIYVTAESDTDTPIFYGTENEVFSGSSVSATHNCSFGWDMDRAVAYSIYTCGYCEHQDIVECEVDVP